MMAVPIHSRIYYGDAQRAIELTATLSIRNTDGASAITITSSRWQDAEGRLVQSEVDAPLVLGPLATRDFPVVEAVMIGRSWAPRGSHSRASAGR